MEDKIKKIALVTGSTRNKEEIGVIELLASLEIDLWEKAKPTAFFQEPDMSCFRMYSVAPITVHY